jgi:hypothetical protein
MEVPGEEENAAAQEAQDGSHFQMTDQLVELDPTKGYSTHRHHGVAQKAAWAAADPNSAGLGGTMGMNLAQTVAVAEVAAEVDSELLSRLEGS